MAKQGTSIKKVAKSLHTVGRNSERPSTALRANGKQWWLSRVVCCVVARTSTRSSNVRFLPASGGPGNGQAAPAWRNAPSVTRTPIPVTHPQWVAIEWLHGTFQPSQHRPVRIGGGFIIRCLVAGIASALRKGFCAPVPKPHTESGKGGERNDYWRSISVTGH